VFDYPFLSPPPTQSRRTPNWPPILSSVTILPMSTPTTSSQEVPLASPRATCDFFPSPIVELYRGPLSDTTSRRSNVLLPRQLFTSISLLRRKRDFFSLKRSPFCPALFSLQSGHKHFFASRRFLWKAHLPFFFLQKLFLMPVTLSPFP